jgi:putative membrane protein insertion efficiency factor
MVSPRLSWPVRLLRRLVRGYRLVLSPLFGPSCRFIPTCSCYADEAIVRWGAGRGLVLAAWRILRCNPFCRGGLDPVPTPAQRPAHVNDDFGSESSRQAAGLVGDSAR